MSGAEPSGSAPAWFVLARSWLTLPIAFALAWAGLNLTSWSGHGQCERWGYGDGTTLPMGFPYVPKTTEGRRLAGSLVIVFGYVGLPALLLGLTGLVAGLWSRALQQARSVLRLASVPLTAATIAIADRLGLLPHFLPPPLQRDFFGDPWLQRWAMWTSVALVAAGLIAWPAAALLRSRKQRRGDL